MNKLIAQIKRVLRIIKHFLKLGCAYVIATILRLTNSRYRNVWIVSERGVDARDNGYFFYKYLKEQHPEINSWYIIDSSSPDASKINKLGNLIEYNSFRHYVFYALCKVRISAHAWGGDLPCADYFHKVWLKSRHRKRKDEGKYFAFINHGITKDYMPFLCSDSFEPELFSCGAKPEYKYIEKSFGHKKGVVQYTGLARFDNLYNFNTVNQILVMPTFRKWLQGMTPEQIRDSEYVKKWNELLNDSNLIKILKANELKLVFYPHHVIQPFIDLFNSGDSSVIIASSAKYDVQELLIESKMLITDFSSVFFDMAYMKKPVLYYQFDRERYLKEHYDTNSGYFSYDTMGFGEVCFEKGKLIEAISNTIYQNFMLQEEYEHRIEVFFPLHDQHNCDRIFNMIISRGGVKHKFVVFLQHGIIKDNMPYLYAENTNFDLFICGAKPEFEYITKRFHYYNDI